MKLVTSMAFKFTANVPARRATATVESIPICIKKTRARDNLLKTLISVIAVAVLVSFTWFVLHNHSNLAQSIKKLLIKFDELPLFIFMYWFFYLTLAVLGWRIWMSIKYRPAPLCPTTQLPSLTIVTPAYNEGQQVYEAICSVAASDYPMDLLHIVAVNDGSKDDTWHWMQQAGRDLANCGATIDLVNMPRNYGKRRAMYEGFVRAKGDILVTIDSDSEVEKHTLKHIASSFLHDPQCGGVAGNVRVLNMGDGLLPRMLDVSFASSFDFIRAGQDKIHTVLCTPGALSAYRKDAVMPVLNEWLVQKFMGRPSHIGEDRALTNLLIRNGYHINYQCNAIVYTKVPTTYSSLCRMLIRWTRSNVRENLMMLPFIFKNFRKGSKFGARLNVLMAFYEMTWCEAVKLLTFGYILADPLFVVPNLITAACIASILPITVYFLRYRSFNCVWAFPYNLLWIFCLSWIGPFCILTMHRSGWMTRGLNETPDATEGLTAAQLGDLVYTKSLAGSKILATSSIVTPITDVVADAA
ncbi:membrane hypothetical protein [Desulfovibrionales bacterium]